MKKNALLCVISVFVVFLLSVGGAEAAGIPAPTMIAPASGTYMTETSPVITGLAPAGMRIAVYIDNTFNGYARTVSEAGGTQSFAYTPFLPLAPGKHSVFTRAENVAEYTRSDLSNLLTFTIEQHYVAPTIIDTIINEESTWNQPWVVGVAPSGAEVVVYIDGIKDGMVKTNTHASGVGDFAYKPSTTLAPGEHTFTAETKTTRADNTVRMSLLSEKFTTSIYDPSLYVAKTTEKETGVTAVVKEETTEEAAEEEEKVVEETTEEASVEEAPAEEEVAEEEVVEEASVEEVSEEPSEEEATGDAADKTSEEEEEAEGCSEDDESCEEEGAMSTEDDDKEAATADDEEGSNTLTFLGWLTLLVVAVIVVTRIRKRRDVPPAFTSSDTSADSPNDGQQQLELQGEDENKNIEVIRKDQQ